LEIEYFSRYGQNARNFPYSRNHSVTDFTLSETGYFVRVYGGRDSEIVGSWILRIEDLRRYRNVDELIESLALPSRPTRIALVEVPEGTIIRKSTAAAQEWTQGQVLRGGGAQYELRTTLNRGQFQELYNNIDDFFK